MTKKAVILLSGGLDSATVLAIATSEGYECYCLSLDYGQRHHFELESAKKVARTMGAKKHLILKLDLSQWGGSALTDQEIGVPRDGEVQEQEEIIPVTYVPARNTIFLSLALGWAEVLGAQDLFIGVNAVDYSGYPDCRPEFIQSFQQTANLATRAGVEGQKFTFHTPLIHLTKREIIQRGLSLGVDYSLTHSCYSPDEKGLSCGRCASCQLRIKGFQDAGSTDPLIYQSH